MRPQREGDREGGNGKISLCFEVTAVGSDGGSVRSPSRVGGCSIDTPVAMPH